MWKWSLFAAVFLLISPAFSTSVRPACGDGIELIYLTYGLSGDAPVKPRYRLEEHVAAAMRAVLEDHRAQTGDIPLLFVEPPELRNAEDLWWSLMRNYRGHKFYGLPHESRVELHPWPGGGSNTFQFSHQGATFRFRQRSTSGNVRAQYNADRLNFLMGLNTSLVSRLSMVNDIQGVATEWVDGRTLGKVSATEIELMIAEGEIDEASFSDASAFEWLVNHSRCGVSRFVITPQKKIIVVDRPCCLKCTTNEPPESDAFYLGWTLPKRYSTRFLQKLRAVDRDALALAIQLDLGSAESAALLFRREVILKDVELRGASALIP